MTAQTDKGRRAKHAKRAGSQRSAKRRADDVLSSTLVHDHRPESAADPFGIVTTASPRDEWPRTATGRLHKRDIERLDALAGALGRESGGSLLQSFVATLKKHDAGLLRTALAGYRTLGDLERAAAVAVLGIGIAAPQKFRREFIRRDVVNLSEFFSTSVASAQRSSGTFMLSTLLVEELCSRTIIDEFREDSILISNTYVPHLFLHELSSQPLAVTKRKTPAAELAGVRQVKAALDAFVGPVEETLLLPLASIQVKELRARIGAILDEVEAGKHVLVRAHTKPLAVLRPCEPARAVSAASETLTRATFATNPGRYLGRATDGRVLLVRRAADDQGGVLLTPPPEPVPAAHDAERRKVHRERMRVRRAEAKGEDLAARAERAEARASELAARAGRARVRREELEAQAKRAEERARELAQQAARARKQ